MGCLKRAVFSSIHYKKRFLLILLIILIASVFLQVSYQIRTTAEQSVTLIRKNIGASVIVNLKDKKLSGIDITDYFPYDIAHEISELPEVKNTHYISMVNVLSDTIKGIQTGSYDVDEHESYWPGVGDFQIVGVSDMQSFWNFKKGIDHIEEGHFLSPDEIGTDAVVSQQIMSTNFLKLGDTIKVSSYFDKDHSVELEIVGVHSGDDLNMVPEYLCNVNYIYVPLDVAIKLNGVNGIMESEYVLTDPAELDVFLEKAKMVAEKYDLGLNFYNNNLDFLLASTALNSLIKTCDAIFITVIAMSAIILSLLVIYLMNDRLFEIGILLSLGESRYKISLQMILEILMPALLAINIGAIVSSVIIPAVGKSVAASMQINQSLTSADIGGLFLLANICGILLVIVASIIPTVAIKKYTPKQMMQTFK